MTTIRVNAAPVTVLPVNEVTAATYTFVPADRLKVVKGDRATGQTFTIPPAVSAPFPTGSILTVCQAGAGQVTIAAGAGVTLRSASGLRLRAQYSAVQIWQETTDVWWIWGDTTP